MEARADVMSTRIHLAASGDRVTGDNYAVSIVKLIPVGRVDSYPTRS